MDVQTNFTEMSDTIKKLDLKMTQCKHENLYLKRNIFTFKQRGLDHPPLTPKLPPEAEGRKERAVAVEPISWRAPVEAILFLQRRLRRLQDRLQQKRRLSYRIGSCSKSKRLWKFERERRLAMQLREIQLSPLQRQWRCLRLQLRCERTAFVDLVDELDALRDEIRSRLEDVESEARLIESYKTLESHLVEGLSNKEEVLRALSHTRNQNRQLQFELADLQKELADINSSIDCVDLKTTILNKNVCRIKEEIENEKNTYVRNVEQFNEELRMMKENYEFNAKFVDFLQNHRDIETFSDTLHRFRNGFMENEKTSETCEIEKVFGSPYIPEKAQRNTLSYRNDKLSIFQKRSLTEKVRRLHKTISNKQKNLGTCKKSKNSLEELKIKIEYQKAENLFLRNLVRRTVDTELNTYLLS